MRALYAAASGMAAQQTRLDTIANNVANVGTTGFKKSRASFQDLFYQELTHGGMSASTSRLDVGGGVQLSALAKNHSTGAMGETGRILDIAIQGAGYLAVEDNRGETLYTRDGNLHIDSDGVLTSSTGLPLMGDIYIPQDARELKILADGTLQAAFANSTEYTTLGQLEISTFVNPSGLQPMGNNIYRATARSGDAMAPEFGTDLYIAQGYLEHSNVDIAEELINMIEAQRAYDLNSKVVKTADEVLQAAANLKR